MQIALTALLVASVAISMGVIGSEFVRVFVSQERPPLSRGTLSRLIGEWAALMLLTLSAPLALLPSWPRRPITAGPAQPPVLLVPGYGLHRISFIPMAAYLRRRQNRWVWAVNNPSWRDDIAAFSCALENAVEQMRQQSGSAEVDIIGHSMGGIVAAHYINTSGAGIVRRLVTLGTPWRGTRMHIFGIGRQSRSLGPSSPQIDAITPVAAPVTALWTKTDTVILPTDHATFEGATAIELENQGHVAMMFSLKTMRAVEAALSSGGEE
ncbi:MAG: alpha/beta fold hydrolase [Myxococcota bacterium]|nr:alpha/beta fold hydrolase [Myxococcota bacterium]